MEECRQEIESKIERIIATTRIGEEGFLPDSKTAAQRIIELLQKYGFKQEQEDLLKVA